MSPSTFRALALATAATCALMSSAHATAYKWTYVGTSATQTWSTATNWDTNGVPVNDGTADVTFTDYASNGYQMKLDPQNSATPSNNWSINSLSFANDGVGSAGRNLAGVNSSATLSLGAGGINQNENSSPSIQVPLIVTASQTWNINNWNGNNTGGLYFGGDGWGGVAAGTGNITLNDGVIVTKSGVGGTGSTAENVEFYAGTTTATTTIPGVVTGGAFKQDGGYFIFRSAGQFGRMGPNAVSITENSKTRGGFLFGDAAGGTFANGIVFTNGTFTNNNLNLNYGNGNVAAGTTMYLTGAMSGVINGGWTNGSGFINTSPSGTGPTYDDRNKIFLQGNSSGLTCTTNGLSGTNLTRGALHSALGITVLDNANALGTGNSLPIFIGNNATDTLNTYCGLLATSGNNVSSNIYARWVENGSTYRTTATEIGLSGTGSVTFSGRLSLNSTSANGYAQAGGGDHQIPRVKLTAPSGGTAIFSGVIADTDSTQPNLAPVTILAGGTVKFSGNNTYKGLTSVRGGTLLLAGYNNALGAATTNVSLGGTVTAPSGGDVVVATTADLSGVSGYTFTAGGAGPDYGTITFSTGPTVIDGITLSNGNRIFYKDASYSPERTGVYTRVDATHWTRVTDLNTPANFSTGLRVHVLYGTLNAGKNYYLPTGLYATSVLNDNSTADSANNFPRSKFLFNDDAPSNTNVAILTDDALTISRNIDVTNNLSTGKSILGGNSAVSSTFSGTVALSRDLTVTAASSGTVTFSGAINGSNNVTKEGLGTVKFSTAKAYTGATSVTAGTLEVDNTLASSGVTVNGGTLNNISTGTISGTATVTSGTLTNAGTISGATSVGSGGTLQGTGTVSSTLSVTGTGIVSPGSGGTGTMTVGSGSTVSGHLAVNVDDLTNTELLSSGTINLTGATLDLTVGGGGFTQPYYVIAQGSSLTGTPSVTTGYTLTNTGTQLRLSLTPTTHSISGTVTLSGSALSGVTVSDGTRTATTDGSGAYTITSVPDLATYTVTPSLTGYTFAPANHSVTLSGADVTGTNFAVANAFGNWATIHGLSGADAAATANPSHDGLSNLVKYALDLNPAVSAQPAGTHSGSSLSFTKGAMAKADSALTYSIEESTDLVTWGPPTLGSVSYGDTITYTYPSGETKVFARLKVTQTP